MKSFLVYGNAIFCGFITFFIAVFFASGTIGENYAGETYVAPQFFLILPIWIIGAVALWRYFSKNKIEDASYIKIIVINCLFWTTIPIGFMFSAMFLGGQ